MKALDFVITEKGNIGMIIETSVGKSFNGPNKTANVSFIDPKCNEKCAWWSESELTVINSLPLFLAKNLSHPFSSEGLERAQDDFPLVDEN